MAREEHILGCSSYSGGGSGGGAAGGGGGGGGGSGCSGGASSISSRSKKIKQKKVPQRGLGVAQLEKIRLEEQQKKQSLQAANILAKNAICSSTSNNNNNNNNNSPSFLAAQCSNLRPPFHNSAPLPPPPSSSSPPSTTNLPSPKPLYRHENSSVRISKNGGGEMGHEEILGTKNNGDNWSRMWNVEYTNNLVGEKKGFSFEPQVNLPYDPSVLPLPIVPHHSRSNQIHRPCSSSSMVNPSLVISPSSELSSPMEPPSNQSFRGNNYVPSWPDEDKKMVGMKRSYPFALESQPLQCNFRPKYDNSVSMSEELASSCNGYAAHIEPRSKCIIREGPLNSTSTHDRKVRQVNRENERLNGDFLTLAPPNMNSKHELFEYETIPSEEYVKSPDSFSFFPIKLPEDETTRHLSNGNNNNNKGEKGETIDLNLKL